MRALACLVALGACAPAPRDIGFDPPLLPPPSSSAPAPRAAPSCAQDRDCRFDAAARACRLDDRWPAAPPLRDQGPVCACEAGACQLFLVEPAPCEDDASCAIDPSPRPHPVRRRLGSGPPAPRPCEGGLALGVRCERTNLCTLLRMPCKHD